MKQFNKLAALLLVLVLALSSLASCGEKDSYKATVSTTFTSEDSAMAEAIAFFEKSEVTLYSSGDKLMIESSAKVSEIEMDKTYTVIDGTLYNNTILKTDAKTVEEKEKAAFDSAKQAELIGKVGAGASIDPEDFTSVTEGKAGKNVTYTCSAIKDDAKASLLAIFGDRFEGFGEVDISDVEYYAEERDGKLQSYIFNARFVITTATATYSVNMTIECEYDYGAKVKINAPEGADGYKETTYDDIIG